MGGDRNSAYVKPRTRNSAHRISYARSRKKSDIKLTCLSKMFLDTIRTSKRANYKQIIDELISQLELGSLSEKSIKNIRRRIYDIINVLAALNVIQKVKNNLEIVTRSTGRKPEVSKVKRRIDRKKKQLQALVKQILSQQALKVRNKGRDTVQKMTALMANSVEKPPFYLIQVKKGALSEVKLTSENRHLKMVASEKFKVLDHTELTFHDNLNEIDQTNVDTHLPAQLVTFMNSRKLLQFLPQKSKSVTPSSGVSTAHTSTNTTPTTTNVTIATPQGYSGAMGGTLPGFGAVHHHVTHTVAATTMTTHGGLLGDDLDRHSDNMSTNSTLSMHDDYLLGFLNNPDKLFIPHTHEEPSLSPNITAQVGNMQAFGMESHTNFPDLNMDEMEQGYFYLDSTT